MTMIGLVTCAERPELTADDQLLGTALVDAGFTWRAVPWNDRVVDWSRFAAVVVRSTWDYHLHLDAFLAWVLSMEVIGVPLWNAPETLRWNANKSYLREMEAAGIETVPTHWVARGDSVDLARILAERGWNEVVIKPAVSATAHGIVRTNAAEVATRGASLTDTPAKADLLVQPFLPEIQQGELSLMFFDGDFSHAVRKRPKAGDYRVQSKFGGSVDPIEPRTSLIDRARSAIAIANDPLYARVDGLEVDGRFMVMELELIEPELFLHASSRAADRFAASITHRLKALAG